MCLEIAEEVAVEPDCGPVVIFTCKVDQKRKLNYKMAYIRDKTFSVINYII